MNTLPFLKKILTQKVSILADRIPPQLYFHELTLAKHLTAYMDFGCASCSKRCTDDSVDDKRCCSSCFDCVGHLTSIPANYHILELYANAFSTPNGFWTSKGCTLPRYLRSGICVTHHCSTKGLTIEDQFILSLITGGFTEEIEKNYVDVLDDKYIDTFTEYESKGKTKIVRYIKYRWVLDDKFIKNESKQALSEFRRNIYKLETEGTRYCT